MEEIQSVKQRLGIIGNDVKLNRAIEKAIQVAPTDISVLVMGESGVGKEYIPRIIHYESPRKHNKYIAVNCGAIPEGTIDSELFGHEKGSFTGASAARSGYFEEADGGTIFLDEIGELPMTTQVRLLRVLENGEFIKVGSSKVLKTNVRIVAATNVDMQHAIANDKFREDLYYRLSTVEIYLPPLRERKEDIHLLFRKFASDFAHKYKMPAVRLDDKAVELLVNYRWTGNVRQMRNLAEQISVLEKERNITAEVLSQYLPEWKQSYLPMVSEANKETVSDFSNEREILYKVLFDMKNDLKYLKKLTLELIRDEDVKNFRGKHEQLINRVYGNDQDEFYEESGLKVIEPETVSPPRHQYVEPLKAEQADEGKEQLSLQKNELNLIIMALEKNKGKRKDAAKELGISERTLYRKLKEYNLE